MLKDISVMNNRRPSPTKAGQMITNIYDTNFKRKLMTGPQAASVYYAPAARNPLVAQNPAVTKQISMKPPQLDSEKFIFQKATKMDSP